MLKQVPVLLAGAWRALTLRTLAWVIGMAFAWTVVLVATQTGYFTEPVPLTPVLNALISMQLNAIAVLVAVLVADQASPLASPRWWPYACAVPAGVLLGTSLTWVLTQRVFNLSTVYQMHGISDGASTFFFRHGSHALIVCGMAAFVYAAQRRAAQRAAGLRDLQRGRAEAERHVVEARLSAARARLEPEFLRRALGDVDALYERDPRVADQVLKELTAYLRATIPEIREPSSTVATEVRLVNAFLNVIALASRDRLHLGAGEALARQARMPPMVLLPLAQHALAADPAASLTLELAQVGHRVVLTMRDRGQAFVPCPVVEQALADVRERLDGLHGAQARLTLQDDAPGSAVAIEFPYVTAGPSVPRASEHMRP
jgi:hypothetical protein